MTLTISCFLIVCPMVFLAGFVDSIAGGGGLISLPAYLLAGVPMHNAIATNKLSSATGTAISTVRLCKNKFVDWGLALPCISMALLGSFVGAHLALTASDKLLKWMLIPILPIVAFYVLKKKNLLRIKYAATVSLTTDLKLFWFTVWNVIKKALKFIFVRKEKDGVLNA